MYGVCPVCSKHRYLAGRIPGVDGSVCPTCKNKWRYHNVPGVAEQAIARSRRRYDAGLCDDYKPNNEKRRLRQKGRYHSDPNFRLPVLMRTRLNQALSKGFKGGSAVSDLGCSIEMLRAYLESKFQPGMTWSNWGREEGQWNIDHIKPLAAFDLTDRQQFLQACHYTNLQPMWRDLNIEKGSKWVSA